jgi:anti-anti-sigma factor
LNLRDVNYIDSSGLGELVSAFTNMRSQGGELKLVNLTAPQELIWVSLKGRWNVATA